MAAPNTAAPSIALAGVRGQCCIESLPALRRRFPNVRRLPRALRIVLESVPRHRHGRLVNDDHVRQLAEWRPGAARLHEIPFVAARSVLQDFTGVPLLADLAATRDAAAVQGLAPTDWSFIEIGPGRLIPSVALGRIGYRNRNYSTVEFI